jgi:hypothetical protein
VIDVEVPAEPLDIGDQVMSCVYAEIDVQVARVGLASAAVPLVEQKDAIGTGVEQPSMPRRAPGAGTSVENQGRLTVRVPARLPVESIVVVDF